MQKLHCICVARLGEKKKKETDVHSIYHVHMKTDMQYM